MRSGKPWRNKKYALTLWIRTYFQIARFAAVCPDCFPSSRVRHAFVLYSSVSKVSLIA